MSSGVPIRLSGHDATMASPKLRSVSAIILLSNGPGATAFLDWFTCNKLPKVGRINLTYALTVAGTTRTEYTIVRLKDDEYYLVSAGAWTEYDADFLKKAIETSFFPELFAIRADL